MNVHTYIFPVARWSLALLYIVFGANKFLFFIDTPPPVEADAQMFLGAMFSSYLYLMVGIAEIAGGFLLAAKRWSFVGSLVLLPVTVNIVAFHIAHDLPGNGIWVLPTILHIAIIYYQKEKFTDLLIQNTQEA